jgi:hypothetical protein
MASAASSTAALTPLLVSPSDLKRARREVEGLDEFLHQAGLRQGGKAVKMPPTSRVILEMAEESKLNLLKKTDRERLLKYLTLLSEKAPVLHMSFASEPTAAFLNKLIVWLRDNIHPQVVVSVGLQPSIAAGCLVRTANRQFDFSLRHSLEQQTAVFVDSLKEGMAVTPPPKPVEAEPTEKTDAPETPAPSAAKPAAPAAAETKVPEKAK